MILDPTKDASDFLSIIFFYLNLKKLNKLTWIFEKWKAWACATLTLLLALENEVAHSCVF